MGQHGLLRGRVTVGEQYLRARPGRHRQPRTDRHGVAQPHRRFERGDAHPGGALASIQLHALAGDLPQPRQDRRARRQQRIVDLPREFGQRGPEPPPALVVAGQQSVHLEARGQPMRGGSGQSGPFTQFGQAARRLCDGVQYAHRFVEHADAAILSHREILAFRIVRLPARHCGPTRRNEARHE